MNPAETARRTPVTAVTLVLLFALAFAIREFTIDRTSLWVDEIIAATHTLVPFLEIPIHLVRFDMHPPLYFLQLDIWALFGTSDGWLRLNSVLWGSAAVGLLYWAMRRRSGESHAFWSALALALLPGAVFYGQEVRMYAMLLVPMILGWHWTCSYFETADPSRREARRLLLAVGAMELAIIYSHAIGFFMVFFLAVFGFALSLRPFDRARFRAWFLVQAVAGIAALPMVASALMRSSASAAPDSGGAIAKHLSFLVHGSTGDPSALMQGIAIAVLVLGGLVALRRRDLRLQTICLVFLPIVLMIAISVTVKPMFKARALTFTYPFLAMALGYGLARASEMLQTRLGRPAAVAPAVLLALAFVPGYVTLTGFRGHQDFRGAAEIMARDWRADDAVIAATNPNFWAVAWYLVGSDWGNPRTVFDMHPQSQWRSMAQKLGPDWTARLNLLPESDAIAFDGGRLYAGIGATDRATEHPRLWYLQYAGRDIPDPLRQRTGLCALSQNRLAGLTLYLLVRQPPSDRCHPWPEVAVSDRTGAGSDRQGSPLGAPNTGQSLAGDPPACLFSIVRFPATGPCAHSGGFGTPFRHAILPGSRRGYAAPPDRRHRGSARGPSAPAPKDRRAAASPRRRSAPHRSPQAARNRRRPPRAARSSRASPEPECRARAPLPVRRRSRSG